MKPPAARRVQKKSFSPICRVSFSPSIGTIQRTSTPSANMVQTPKALSKCPICPTQTLAMEIMSQTTGSGEYGIA